MNNNNEEGMLSQAEIDALLNITDDDSRSRYSKQE